MIVELKIYEQKSLERCCHIVSLCGKIKSYDSLSRIPQCMRDFLNTLDSSTLTQLSNPVISFAPDWLRILFECQAWHPPFLKHQMCRSYYAKMQLDVGNKPYLSTAQTLCLLISHIFYIKSVANWQRIIHLEKDMTLVMSAPQNFLRV